MIYYKHKETGYYLSHDTVKRNLGKDINILKRDCLMPISIEDYKTQYQTYRFDEIPFSDDFEAVYDIDFTIENLNAFANAIYQAIGDLTTKMEMVQKVDELIRIKHDIKYNSREVNL